MHTSRQDFDPDGFSFHQDPVLIVENFWTAEERQVFRRGLASAPWTSLAEMPQVRKAFPNCGNWGKAEIAGREAAFLLRRLALPCIERYIESFPDIRRRHMSFSYYAYAAGDCLLTHDDTVQPAPDSPVPSPALFRRIALVSYLHDEWHPDWGGELMIYAKGEKERDDGRLSITHCIAPLPGSLVLFTVPRFHRVCRVDPLGGGHRRLSIAGWFMTEHGR